MFPNALTPEITLVLPQLTKLSFLKDYYLGGGTALALQLGHRKSIDLDFFINKLPPHEAILVYFKDKNPQILLSDETGLNIMLGKVKVSFLQYPYPLLEELIEYEGINLNQILDIACMKLNAIISRGEKKDFYDLYEILKKYPLKELIEAFDKKFQGYNYDRMAILKPLIYFDDADKSEMPELIKNTSWDEVKKVIVERVKEYTNEN